MIINQYLQIMLVLITIDAFRSFDTNQIEPKDATIILNNKNSNLLM